jgi:hypothetical protein
MRSMWFQISSVPPSGVMTLGQERQGEARGGVAGQDDRELGDAVDDPGVLVRRPGAELAAIVELHRDLVPGELGDLGGEGLERAGHIRMGWRHEAGSHRRPFCARAVARAI